MAIYAIIMVVTSFWSSQNRLRRMEFFNGQWHGLKTNCIQNEKFNKNTCIRYLFLCFNHYSVIICLFVCNANGMQCHAFVITYRRNRLCILWECLALSLSIFYSILILGQGTGRNKFTRAEIRKLVYLRDLPKRIYISNPCVS